MPQLANYEEFAGRHWETGSVHNALSYLRYTAPHTDQPYSEALLLGVSGGIAFGYFFFHYEGHDPHVALLTRNTFDPWETMLSRLGVAQEVKHTSSADKGKQNLLEALENGEPPIIWADSYSLPYNFLPNEDGMWAMMPIVVYGYDESDGIAQIADRSRKPLHVTTEVLDAARARVKKDKFRVITLAAPQLEKLATAVQKGIWDTIKLYTEKPPRGAKNNFGFAAYERWAELLTRPTKKQSWAKFFPAGGYWYNGLVTAFEMGFLYGQGDSYQAERDVYADFLDEAATILEKPDLGEVAAQFRRSGEAWHELSRILLPDEMPLLGKTQELLKERHDLFLNNPGKRETMEAINAEQAALRQEARDDFPFSEEEVKQQQERIAEQIMRIRDIEQEAITALQAAMQ